MKKSTLQTIVVSFLLMLSFSAYVYVNTNTQFQISDSEMSEQQEEIIEEQTETEITFIEAEFLKKIIKKAASNLPTKL